MPNDHVSVLGTVFTAISGVLGDLATVLFGAILGWIVAAFVHIRRDAAISVVLEQRMGMGLQGLVDDEIRSPAQAGRRDDAIKLCRTYYFHFGRRAAGRYIDALGSKPEGSDLPHARSSGTDGGTRCIHPDHGLLEGVSWRSTRSCLWSPWGWSSSAALRSGQRSTAEGGVPSLPQSRAHGDGADRVRGQRGSHPRPVREMR